MSRLWERLRFLLCWAVPVVIFSVVLVVLLACLFWGRHQNSGGAQQQHPRPGVGCSGAGQGGKNVAVPNLPNSPRKSSSAPTSEQMESSPTPKSEAIFATLAPVRQESIIPVAVPLFSSSFLPRATVLEHPCAENPHSPQNHHQQNPHGKKSAGGVGAGTRTILPRALIVNPDPPLPRACPQSVSSLWRPAGHGRRCRSDSTRELPPGRLAAALQAQGHPPSEPATAGFRSSTRPRGGRTSVMSDHEEVVWIDEVCSTRSPSAHHDLNSRSPRLSSVDHDTSAHLVTGPPAPRARSVENRLPRYPKTCSAPKTTPRALSSSEKRPNTKLLWARRSDQRWRAAVAQAGAKVKSPTPEKGGGSADPSLSADPSAEEEQEFRLTKLMGPNYGHRVRSMMVPRRSTWDGGPRSDTTSSTFSQEAGEDSSTSPPRRAAGAKGCRRASARSCFSPRRKLLGRLKTNPGQTDRPMDEVRNQEGTTSKATLLREKQKPWRSKEHGGFGGPPVFLAEDPEDDSWRFPYGGGSWPPIPPGGVLPSSSTLGFSSASAGETGAGGGQNSCCTTSLLQGEEEDPPTLSTKKFYPHVFRVSVHPSARRNPHSSETSVWFIDLPLSMSVRDLKRKIFASAAGSSIAEDLLYTDTRGRVLEETAWAGPSHDDLIPAFALVVRPSVSPGSSEYAVDADIKDCPLMPVGHAATPEWWAANAVEVQGPGGGGQGPGGGGGGGENRERDGGEKQTNCWASGAVGSCRIFGGVGDGDPFWTGGVREAAVVGAAGGWRRLGPTGPDGGGGGGENRDGGEEQTTGGCSHDGNRSSTTVDGRNQSPAARGPFKVHDLTVVRPLKVIVSLHKSAAGHPRTKKGYRPASPISSSPTSMLSKDFVLNQEISATALTTINHLRKKILNMLKNDIDSSLLPDNWALCTADLGSEDNRELLPIPAVAAAQGPRGRGTVLDAPWFIKRPWRTVLDARREVLSALPPLEETVEQPPALVLPERRTTPPCLLQEDDEEEPAAEDTDVVYFSTAGGGTTAYRVQTNEQRTRAQLNERTADEDTTSAKQRPQLNERTTDEDTTNSATKTDPRSCLPRPPPPPKSDFVCFTSAEHSEDLFYRHCSVEDSCITNSMHVAVVRPCPAVEASDHVFGVGAKPPTTEVKWEHFTSVMGGFLSDIAFDLWTPTNLPRRSGGATQTTEEKSPPRKKWKKKVVSTEERALQDILLQTFRRPPCLQHGRECQIFRHLMPWEEQDIEFCPGGGCSPGDYDSVVGDHDTPRVVLELDEHLGLRSASNGLVEKTRHEKPGTSKKHIEKNNVLAWLLFFFRHRLGNGLKIRRSGRAARPARIESDSIADFLALEKADHFPDEETVRMTEDGSFVLLGDEDANISVEKKSPLEKALLAYLAAPAFRLDGLLDRPDHAELFRRLAAGNGKGNLQVKTGAARLVISTGTAETNGRAFHGYVAIEVQREIQSASDMIYRILSRTASVREKDSKRHWISVGRFVVDPSGGAAANESIPHDLFGGGGARDAAFLRSSSSSSSSAAVPAQHSTGCTGTFPSTFHPHGPPPSAGGEQQHDSTQYVTFEILRTATLSWAEEGLDEDLRQVLGMKKKNSLLRTLQQLFAKVVALQVAQPQLFSTGSPSTLSSISAGSSSLSHVDIKCVSCDRSFSTEVPAVGGGGGGGGRTSQDFQAVESRDVPPPGSPGTYGTAGRCSPPSSTDRRVFLSAGCCEKFWPRHACRAGFFSGGGPLSRSL